MNTKVRAVEKVHEDTRLHAPRVHGVKRWVLGDIVEVLDLHSWRAGKIVKVLRNDYFVVRIFGSIQLKEFHVSKLRVQEAWRGDELVVTDKVGGKKQLDKACSRARVTGTGKKRRTILKEGSSPSKKVDAASFSDPMGGKNRMHASIRDRMTKMEVGHRHAKNHDMHSPSISIASCSANNLPEYTTRNTVEHSRDISSSSVGDASSSCPLISREEKFPILSLKKLDATIHGLELHAYRSTVQALYVSGPLSWEQESLLTNLRLSLHITTDEHLLQLKNLLCS